MFILRAYKKEEESPHLKDGLIPPDYMYRFYSPTRFDKEPKKIPTIRFLIS